MAFRSNAQKTSMSLQIRINTSEINNLYRPNASFKSESFEDVYVQIRDFPDKFLHIALKEWFLLVKPKGKLHIEYPAQSERDLEILEKSLWWMARGDYIITKHEIKRNKGRLVLTKIRSMVANLGLMNEWTFGIVTNGERDDWIEEIISSIRAQHIPKYEIIVCGKYRDRDEANFKYIDFNERSDRGWITRKKNVIAQHATYENMCILHDRLVFDRDWYKGMRLYGNAFEFLGCRQIEKKTGETAGDWLTLGGPSGTRWKISRLEYTDWDYYGYLSGQLIIMKKSIWKKTMWDETRYWDGVDDADWDIIFRARDLGYVIRFNPYASVTALVWRHGKLPLKYDVSEGLLPKDMLMRRSMRLTARIFLALPLIEQFHTGFYNLISKTKFYKHFIYH